MYNTTTKREYGSSAAVIFTAEQTQFEPKSIVSSGLDFYQDFEQAAIYADMGTFPAAQCVSVMIRILAELLEQNDADELDEFIQCLTNKMNV